MIKPAFEILNQRGTPMFFSDVFANRPAPGIIGRIFISTDTNLIYRDTGTTWNLIGGGTATIGGTIAAGQVAYGTALNTIGGSNNLFWDNGNGRLGIGTNLPTEFLHIQNGRALINWNQNGLATFTISNTTTHPASASALYLTSDGGTTYFAKRSTQSGGYKIFGNSDSTIINSTAGDISILNDVVTGQIKFAAGGSSTAHLTIAANGTGTFSTSLIVNQSLQIGNTTNGFSFSSNSLQTYGNISIAIQGDRTFSFTDSTFTSTYFRIVRNTGNVLIGTTTDAGQRFQVNGTTYLNGNTQITQALSFGTDVARASMTFFSDSSRGIIIQDNAAGTANVTTLTIGNSTANNTGKCDLALTNNFDGGIGRVYTKLFLSGNFNDIAGSGISRAIYINTTISAINNYRAFEWTNNNGFGLYGSGSALNYLNGKLSIGSTTIGTEMVNVLSSATTRIAIRSSGAGATFNTGFLLGTSSASRWSIASYGLNSDFVFYNETTLTNSFFIFGLTNNLIVGSTLVTPVDQGEKLQIIGTQRITDTRTYSTGAIQSLRLEKNLTLPSGASISGGSTISNQVLGGTTTIQGNINIPNSAPFAGIYASNLYSFSAGSLTLTSSQAAGTRAISQIAAQNYFGGVNSGTFTDVASIQIGAFLNNNTGSITPVITNAYQLLINDINESSHTFTIANRWGIYQEGTSDRNYLKAKTLIGSNTDTGEQFQLTGSIRVNNQLSGTAGGSSGQHLIINCDGTIYKIALLNN